MRRLLLMILSCLLMPAVSRAQDTTQVSIKNETPCAAVLQLSQAGKRVATIRLNSFEHYDKSIVVVTGLPLKTDVTLKNCPNETMFQLEERLPDEVMALTLRETAPASIMFMKRRVAG